MAAYERAPYAPTALLGGLAVATAHLLSLPRGAWEGDEILFMKGVELFDPVHHQPHPPGYPLLIGLGKLFHFFLNDSFTSLSALAVLSSVVCYFALLDAFSRVFREADPRSDHRRAVVGAALFSFSPAMLIYGPTALSDAPAVMFLALALAAAARVRESPTLAAAGGLGAATAGAIGCRPQLALAALPMMAIALWQAQSRRQAAIAVGGFTVVSLLWFLPLLAATGGLAGLFSMLRRQASLVATYDSAGPRAGAAIGHAAVRFLAHPWGQRWTALPVLALASIGGVRLARFRAAGVLPLAALFGVEAVLGLWVTHPVDAVRYAIPSLALVAFTAAAGSEAVALRFARPAVSWCFTVLAALAFVGYTSGIRSARSASDSPPAQAATWIQRSVPPDAAVLVDKELAPHASYLLKRFDVIPADDAGWVLHCGPATPTLAPRRATYLLGDGESSWPEAVTFRWPASDAYGKLTRGHFRVVSVSSIAEAQLYRAVSGVGPFEPSALQPTWRWLEPEATIRVFLRGAPSSRFRATLAVPSNSPIGVATVSILVDGVAQSTIVVSRNAQRAVNFSVPPGAQSSEVTFRSRESFVPAQLGLGADTRRLAVQLTGLECLPR